MILHLHTKQYPPFHQGNRAHSIFRYKMSDRPQWQVVTALIESPRVHVMRRKHHLGVVMATPIKAVDNEWLWVPPWQAFSRTLSTTCVSCMTRYNNKYNIPYYSAYSWFNHALSTVHYYPDFDLFHSNTHLDSPGSIQHMLPYHSAKY